MKILMPYNTTVINKPRINRSSKRGFTLIELLIIVVIIGVLAAVSIPSWLRFLAKHRVTIAQGQLHQGIQQAQLKSQQESISWQFSVRENSDVVEMSVHPSATLPSLSVWEQLNTAIQLDSETNLAISGGVYYVSFDAKGNVYHRLGRVTLSSKQFSDIKRCVIVSTLIGATRTAQEKPTPDNGKYCY